MRHTTIFFVVCIVCLQNSYNSRYSIHYCHFIIDTFIEFISISQWFEIYNGVRYLSFSGARCKLTKMRSKRCKMTITFLLVRTSSAPRVLQDSASIHRQPHKYILFVLID